MASVLIDMSRERQELKDRLKDFDNLEKNLYPEIEHIVEMDMNYDCIVNLCQGDEACCYNAFRVRALKNNKIHAMVEVKFASATSTGDYKVTRITPDGKTSIEHAMCGRYDLMDIIESMLARSLKEGSEAKHQHENSGKCGICGWEYNRRNGVDHRDFFDVDNAKECKAALDKFVVGSSKLKGYGLETVLTEDASVGAEMPFARVELGIRADKDSTPYFKAGDLLEYYTFDFSGGTCHITFHLQGESLDEEISDYPSVTSMVKDLVPHIIDELENHDFVNRPGRDGRPSEAKKAKSLTLKELKDMARSGQAEDITTISDEEAKALRKKGIETIGVSRGAYGMNGALLCDNEGKKYVITARNSNLFYFV